MSKQDKNINTPEDNEQQKKMQSAEEVPADASETPADKQQEEEPADPLDAALAEIEKLKQKLLYTTAEFDNYRKRTLKEKSELILNGSSTTLEALLPVIDDMERAIEGQDAVDDVEALKEGQQLIYKKLMHVLSTLGLKAIDTKDQLFDVDFHEAVAMVPTDDDTNKGKVIDCVQKGYTLNGKVLRHAKVAVGQ